MRRQQKRVVWQNRRRKAHLRCRWGESCPWMATRRCAASTRNVQRGKRRDQQVREELLRNSHGPALAMRRRSLSAAVLYAPGFVQRRLHSLPTMDATPPP
jgi:hypothetical protein